MQVYIKFGDFISKVKEVKDVIRFVTDEQLERQMDGQRAFL